MPDPTPDPDPTPPGAPSPPGPVTRVLTDGGLSPAEALEQVLPTVYAELRALAAHTLGPGSPHSVQPTDLLHEAWVRLSKERQGWSDRANLMVAAAVAMRRALVDHVRRRRAVKRGGDRTRVDELDEVAIHDRRFDTLELEDALSRLEALDAEAAQVAELRLFGGFDAEECATALDVSTRTIERRWRFARAWLVDCLGGAGDRGE
ncbi:MAG: ECF-type sigma factor [Planctomycetota bacterium]